VKKLSKTSLKQWNKACESDFVIFLAQDVGFAWNQNDLPVSSQVRRCESDSCQVKLQSILINEQPAESLPVSLQRAVKASSVAHLPS
jgi:hypothetical protein